MEDHLEEDLEQEVSVGESPDDGEKEEDTVEEEESENTHTLADAEVPIGLVLRNHTKSYSLKDIVNHLDDDRYTLDAEYQRAYCWDNYRASALIDTALESGVIPAIIICQRYGEDDDRPIEVLDGKQRLTTFHRFIKGEFKLVFSEARQKKAKGKGLQRKNKHLNGLTFSELPLILQKKLLNYDIHFIILFAEGGKEVPPEAIYNQFLRLQEGKPLGPQEIRNASYPKVLPILKRFSENHPLLSNLWRGKPETNGADLMDIAIRFLTLRHSLKLKEPLSNYEAGGVFLLKGMKMVSEMKPKEVDQEYTAFNKAVSLFGEMFNSFSTSVEKEKDTVDDEEETEVEDTKETKDTKEVKKKVKKEPLKRSSKKFAELCLVLLADVKPSSVISTEQKVLLRNAIVEVVNQPTFNKLLKTSTDTKYNVQYLYHHLQRVTSPLLRSGSDSYYSRVPRPSQK